MQTWVSHAIDSLDRPSRTALSLCLGNPALASLPQPTSAEILRLVDVLEYHRLTAFAHQRLRAGGVGPALHDAASAIAAAELRWQARWAGMRADLREIVLALKAAHIPVVLLKGAHLAHVAYRNGLRMMCDLDLLIAPEQIDQAAQILLGLGYGSAGSMHWQDYGADADQLSPFYRPGSTKVELHWALEARNSPFELDHQRIWQRATPCPGVPGALALAPEDLLLHLVLHASFHHGWRVGMVVLFDFQAVLKHWAGQFDWAYLAAEAKRSKAEPHVSAALGLMDAVLGEPLPESVLQVFSAESRSAHRLEKIFRQLMESPQLGELEQSVVSYMRYKNAPGGLWQQGIGAGLAYLARRLSGLPSPAEQQAPPRWLLPRLKAAARYWRHCGGFALRLLQSKLIPERRKRLAQILEQDRFKRNWRSTAPPSAGK